MAKFFIDRPIFAWVIALFVIVLGAVSITQLPIAQYPSVAPPTIVVSAAYPGASAQTLEDSVLAVIEREMNGTPGLAYMESVSQANGTATITISFEPGTSPDLAQVDVQNRLSRATPRLPQAEHLGHDHDRAVRVEKMAQYIGEHALEDISSEDVAAAAGLHPNYAMSLFKRAVGITIKQSITRQRLDMAQSMLIATDLPVATIAFDCGFGSLSSFYAAFEQRFHKSPAAFRLSYDKITRKSA